MIIGLLGNQNSGKTTLFNQLTGSNQRVGNFPGVTVERKMGSVRKHDDVDVVDLPGIYSLAPYSNDEIVTREFLTEGSADVLINIIDVTNISRGLYLTMQLLELETPMVIALNMMDEFRKTGGHVHPEQISLMLGIPVVPISAARGEGVSELVRVAIETGRSKQISKISDICSGPVHRTAHAIGFFLEDHARRAHLPQRYVALRLIDGDEDFAQKLGLSDNELDTIEHMVAEMEADSGLDRVAALAAMRYEFIDKLYSECFHFPAAEKTSSTQQIDRVLTNRVAAIPIFFMIFALVFWLSFGGIGGWLSGLFETGISSFTDWTAQQLTQAGANPVLQSLLTNGILGGVGSVLSFLPLIIVLFFFLSLLEDTGYMARVAFVMDKPLRKIGLSGESIVPMLMGFGCTVPATMATRTLPSTRDRRMTIFLLPFMSCSAKVPIYAVFSAAFFPQHTALIMTILYISGVLLAISVSAVLKNSAFRGEPIPFILELPAYRLPSMRSVALNLWDKAKDFLTRAFTVIFLATVLIWLLSSFTFGLQYTDSMDNSILASVSSFLVPVFAPIGFGNWQSVTSLITGLTAKEAVVGTLAVLMGDSDAALSTFLSQLFTRESALAFLTFTLLYAPCIAAIAAARRELGNRRDTAVFVFGQTAVAWLISFLVYRVALGWSWAYAQHGVIAAVSLVAIAVVLFVGMIAYAVRLLHKNTIKV